MARHMRESEAQRTTVVPRQERRPATTPRPATAQRLVTTQRRNVPYDEPYGRAASYRGLMAEPVVRRELTWDDAPARGGIFTLARGLVLLLAWLVRLCAFAMVLLVLLNALSLPFFRTTLSRVTDLITSYLPWARFGILAVDTPFGGVFRGDLAIISLVLFIIDWLLCKLRASLR